MGSPGSLRKIKDFFGKIIKPVVKLAPVIGAAVGSIVPGIGTAAGAAAGTAISGISKAAGLI
jgi:hypothetical protein